MKSKTQAPKIEAGQIYIEDLGAGKLPNRMEIVDILPSPSAGQLVRYRTSSSQLCFYKMPLNRFEGLIRAGVFVLKPTGVPATTKCSSVVESLRREIHRLTVENLDLRIQIVNATKVLTGAKD